MTRRVVGILLAVRPARFGPWDQDVAMVPTPLVRAVQQLGWLPLLLAADAPLASHPHEATQLVDGLIVPDWSEDGDRNADFSRALGEAAEARGLPVLRLPASLVVGDPTVDAYAHAVADLFAPEAHAASGVRS